MKSNDKLLADVSLLMERQLAVAEAIKAGKRTYQFSSNYTPGLGRITDPTAYEQSWAMNAKKNIPDSLKPTIAGNYLK